MKVYQVHCIDDCEESKGYTYHASRPTAEMLMADLAAKGFKPTLAVLEFQVSTSGLLKALRACGSHPDNG